VPCGTPFEHLYVDGEAVSFACLSRRLTVARRCDGSWRSHSDSGLGCVPEGQQSGRCRAAGGRYACLPTGRGAFRPVPIGVLGNDSVRHFLEVLDELNHLNIEFVSFRENLDIGSSEPKLAGRVSMTCSGMRAAPASRWCWYGLRTGSPGKPRCWAIARSSWSWVCGCWSTVDTRR
jgi:hypothetical protein